MAILQLDYELDYDFGILGISSVQKAYTLSWEINRLLESELVLMPSLEYTSKKGLQNFKLYENQQEEFPLQLVANRDESHRLIPEYTTIDYFLKYYEEESPYNCTELMSILRKSKLVQAIFKIEISKLKSKQAFLF